MLTRDELGIIVDNQNRDGGDSCSRTAIMALCGSEQDKQLLTLFGPADALKRHPAQVPWNNPLNFTRDQLVCYVSALKEVGYTHLARQVLYACIKRGFRAQNIEKDYPGTPKTWPDGADPLSPADILHLGVCADLPKPILLLLSIVGLPWFLLNLVWMTKITPNAEQNQIICQCLTFGKWATWLYVKLQPDYPIVWVKYWCRWRDQQEIFKALCDKVWKVAGV